MICGPRTSKALAVASIATFSIPAIVHAQNSSETTQAQAICDKLIERFYWTQDDDTGTSLMRQNDSCDCALTEDSQVFLLECRLDYCPECNSLGVCGVWIFQNRYNAASLLSDEKISNDPDQALLDFAQCVDYVQGRNDRICVTTSTSSGQTCRLSVNDEDCNSCTWDDTICLDSQTGFSGGFIFDCQNMEGGHVFNSCNEVSDGAQPVTLDSPFAYFDHQSLQFVSCYDPTAIVITPPPTEPPPTDAPILGGETGSVATDAQQGQDSSNSQSETSGSSFPTQMTRFQTLVAFLAMGFHGILCLH